jgi:hypothetical protein
MKQKDVALIIVIAFISAVASLVVSRLVFSSPGNRSQQVDVVQSINAQFPSPAFDPRYFNSGSIDPTQLIQIGNTTNSNPFNGSSQP